MLLISLILAVLCGLGFGVLYPLGMRLIGVPMDGADSLVVGLLFGVLAFPAILLVFRYQQGRVRKAVEKLPSPHTHAFSLMMQQNGKSQPMTVFLCEDCLCLVDMDKRALPMTVCPAAEIIHVFRISDREMELHLTQDRVLTFRTGATQALYSALKARGWLPFQH